MKSLILSFTLLQSIQAFALDVTCNTTSCVSTNDALFETIDTTPTTKNLVTKDLTGYNINIYSSNDSGNVNALLFGNLSTLNIISNSNDATGFKKSTIVAGHVDDLSVASQGFNGIDGKNTSRLCAERFISGNYGVDAYNFFASHHTLDSTVKCDSSDYAFLLNNKFACDSSYTIFGTSSASISLLESKRACRANIVRNKCVKKTFNINCNQRLTGLKCCASNSSWANLTTTSLPHSFITSQSGASCIPTNCAGQFNGYEILKSFIGTIEDVNNSGYCSNKISSSAPTISYGAGSLVSSVTVNAKTRNNVSLPLPTVKDSLGNVLPSSDYAFIITNVISVNGQGLSIRNCFGLDGTPSTDYSCDIKPGPATTIKLKAIDKNGNLSTSEVSININESIYMKEKITNSYSCVVMGSSCSYIIGGSSTKYTYSDNSTIGSIDRRCSPTGYGSTGAVYSSPSNSFFSYCDSSHGYYSYNTFFDEYVGNTRIFANAYSETNETGIKVYADFNGIFP